MGLRVDALSCERGGRLVLRDITFAVPDGEVAILRGPNGAGKSTLLRALVGLLPHGGRVEIDGRAPDRDALSELVAYNGHLDAVKPQLTVAENLRFWARVLGGDPDPALAAFGLARIADRPAHLLSAGQRRRLGLARLLLAPRRVWLLDEPTTALDADAMLALLRAVRDHTSAGGVAVVATHGPIGVPAEIRIELSAEAAQASETASDPFLAGAWT
jgi:heme exporter protein A